jgi:nucleoside-diphosphate kinase
MKPIFLIIFLIVLQTALVAQPNNGRAIINNMPQQKVERTLSIIKPDAVRNRHIGDIIARFENHGLHVIALKMIKLNQDQAAQFYAMHRDQPFFQDLIQFMSSGPVVVMVLEGDQAISKTRQLMGATDPTKAEKGTIRAEFGESTSHNAVHGSDSLESANKEIPYFFRPDEIYSGYY